MNLAKAKAILRASPLTQEQIAAITYLVERVGPEDLIDLLPAAKAAKPEVKTQKKASAVALAVNSIQ